MADVVAPISPKGHLPNLAIWPNQQRSIKRNTISFQFDRPRKTNKKKIPFRQKSIKDGTIFKGTEEKINGHVH